MAIEGEELNGVYSAREIVNWYNGHPHFINFSMDFENVNTMTIIGYAVRRISITIVT